MRIHTDTLTYAQVWAVTRNLQLWPEILTEHGSRKRDHAFELQISGSSPRMAQSGKWAAATWDEWGALLGALFNMDPGMTTSYYESADAFHRLTCDRFRNGSVPEDTHAQHKWVYDFANSKPFSGNRVVHCNKCSASMSHG